MGRFMVAVMLALLLSLLRRRALLSWPLLALEFRDRDGRPSKEGRSKLLWMLPALLLLLVLERRLSPASPSSVPESARSLEYCRLWRRPSSGLGACSRGLLWCFGGAQPLTSDPGSDETLLLRLIAGPKPVAPPWMGRQRS